MSAWNVERYIDQAIQSVLTQEGVPFELLIGDDASSDRTWARVQDHLRDPRVYAWRFPLHRDAGTVRNRLMARARGIYLCVCDADDILLPGALRRLASILDKKPGIGGVFGDHLQWMDEQGNLLPKRIHFPGPENGWDLIRAVIPHGGTLVRRSLIEQVGGYRLGLEPIEDYDLFLRVAEIASFKPLSGEVHYLWRRRPDSISRLIPHRRRALLLRKVRLDAMRRRYPWAKQGGDPRIRS